MMIAPTPFSDHCFACLGTCLDKRQVQERQAGKGEKLTLPAP